MYKTKLLIVIISQPFQRFYFIKLQRYKLCYLYQLIFYILTLLLRQWLDIVAQTVERGNVEAKMSCRRFLYLFIISVFYFLLLPLPLYE